MCIRSVCGIHSVFMCSVQNVYLHVVCGSYLCGMCGVCSVCVCVYACCTHGVCGMCSVESVCGVCICGCACEWVWFVRAVYVLLSRVCDVPGTHGVCVWGCVYVGVVHPEFTVESQARQRDVGTEVGV